jgi:uncharacterized protein
MTAPKAVFDTVSYLQAVTNPNGPAWAALELTDAGRIRLVASEETLREVVDVLSRPNIRKRFPSLTDERLGQFLQVIRLVAEMLVDVPRIVSLERDPKDEPFLNLAITSGAAYLVTRDKDMLDLMQDGAFRAAHPGLRIIGPVELLKELTPSRAIGGQSSLISTVRRLGSVSQMGCRPSRILTRRVSEGPAAITPTQTCGSRNPR